MKEHKIPNIDKIKQIQNQLESTANRVYQICVDLYEAGPETRYYELIVDDETLAQAITEDLQNHFEDDNDYRVYYRSVSVYKIKP